MHEPSVVMIRMSSSCTKYSPGSTFTASFGSARRRRRTRPRRACAAGLELLQPPRAGAGPGWQGGARALRALRGRASWAGGPCDGISADADKLQPRRGRRDQASDALVDGLAAQRNRSRESVKFSEWPTYSRPPGLHHAVHRSSTLRCVGRRSRSSRCGRTPCRRARPATSSRLIRLKLRNSISGQLGLDADEAGVGARAAQEVALAAARATGRGRRRVDAALGGGQHLGVDVAATMRLTWAAAQRLHHRHGDRVGLFAGGWRRCTRCAAAAAGDGAQVVDQGVEVVVLAEEGGQVGGQAVDELLPLGVASAGVASSHCR
jgi:hypothetical protein